jgi:2-dehydro-3-deoxygluconokinase
MELKKSGNPWDLLSLGEVMLRLDPGEGRIHTTRHFNVWEGGGEYNVARSLRRCFGLHTAIATALADNPVGRLVEDLILQGGVDTSLLHWVPYDGVGRSVRNGLNFVERGFGARAPLGCSDRGHTAIAQVSPDTWNWPALFAQNSIRALHTGGVFAALGDNTAAVAKAAISAARAAGALISYDFNYRPSLWAGREHSAAEINSALVREADILFAGEHDFSHRLGVSLEGIPHGPERRHEILLRAHRAYPNLRAIAMTERIVESSCRHHWGAAALVDGNYFVVETRHVEVLDRIGCGDSFAAGFLYGLLTGKDPLWSLRCGVAHGALAMSTPGDTSMATLAEVLKEMEGGAVRTER